MTSYIQPVFINVNHLMHRFEFMHYGCGDIASLGYFNKGNALLKHSAVCISMSNEHSLCPPVLPEMQHCLKIYNTV